MPRARSAKGEVVDFDLLRIKQQIASAPKPATVSARENYVDKKLKRRVNRIQRQSIEMLPESDITTVIVEPPISAVEVDVTMPVETTNKKKK